MMSCVSLNICLGRFQVRAVLMAATYLADFWSMRSLSLVRNPSVSQKRSLVNAICFSDGGIVVTFSVFGLPSVCMSVLIKIVFWPSDVSSEENNVNKHLSYGFFYSLQPTIPQSSLPSTS